MNHSAAARLTTVITGANRGIGLELARQCHARGDRVLALCRQAGSELPALDVEIIEGIDVTAVDALQRAAATVGSGGVDLLIANAGLLSVESFAALGESAAQEQIRAQFAVNALAPLLTVHAFSGTLQPGAKVALITSRMGSMADNGSGGYYGYRMSKAALNAAGRSLAIDLAPRGISVALLHPGYVRTEMTGGQGNVEAAESARMLLERIDELQPSRSGQFWHASGEVLPW